MATEPVSVAMDAGTGTPADFPVLFKKIMEIPPPNLLEGDDGKYLSPRACAACGRCALQRRMVDECILFVNVCQMHLVCKQHEL